MKGKELESRGADGNGPDVSGGAALKIRKTTKSVVLRVWDTRYGMDFFNSAIEVLETLVIALGAGLGVWGAINLLEGYGNDNRATRS